MFSYVTFLAEGEFGVVHKGIFKDGQVVAVKQLKFGILKQILISARKFGF